MWTLNGAEVSVVDRRAAERVRSVRLAGEPRGLGDRTGEEPQERQHDRPADPVAERGNRPHEGCVLAPPLVRVEGKAARLVREHRRQLRVEDHHEHDQAGRDPPEHDCAPPAQVEDRIAERAEQEARIGKGDHETVVPAECLDQMSFFDNCLRHRILLALDRFSRAGRRPTVPRWADGFNCRKRLSGRRSGNTISRNEAAADHDHMRLRRQQGRGLRRTLALRALRALLGHPADPGGRVRGSAPQGAARASGSARVRRC